MKRQECKTHGILLKMYLEVVILVVLTTFLRKYKGEFRDNGGSSDTVFESSWNNDNRAEKE